MHEPPKGGERHHAHEDDGVVVHAHDRGGQGVREAIQYVEEGREHDRRAVDEVARFPHVEGPGRDVLAAGEEVGREGEDVGGGAENDEGAREVGEGGAGAEGDGAEAGGQDSREHGGFDGTAELLVDVGEEAGEGDGVVAGQGPPGAANGEEGADQAGREGEEDDEEEAERCGAGAGGLEIGLGKGEGAVAALDGGEVIDAVEEGDGEEEGEEETEG